MFPYYLLPNADDTQEPDAEEAPEREAPRAVDSAVQDYENNLYHRLGLRPPTQTGAPGSSPSDSGLLRPIVSYGPVNPSPPPIPNDIIALVSPSGSHRGSDKPKAGEDTRKMRPSAHNKQSAAAIAPDIEQPPDDLAASDLVTFMSAGSPDWYGSTPLTQGQEMHVDHLLSVETDTLAREVLIGLKREGMPSEAYVSDFMSQYAEWGWDDLSSALALQVLANVRDSDWDEWLGHADSEPVEAEAQDLEGREAYVPAIGVKVSGTLRVYADERFDRNVDTPFLIYPDADSPVPFRVYRYSQANPFVVLVEIGDSKFWIDTTDEDAQFIFVALGEQDETFTQAPEEVVAVGNPSEDEILPIIPDEKDRGGSLDIEGEIPRWDELKSFVNTDLTEFQRLAVENPEIIPENMALLEDIFEYDVRFHDDEFYVGEGKKEEKRSAIKQIFNIASSHYHVTNTFGIEILRTTATATIYYLSADLGTDPVIEGYQPEYRGLVPLAAGETGAFIGSEMTIGGITHETFHEIDRRFGGSLSVHYYYDKKKKRYEGVGGLEWFLSTKVINRHYGTPLGFNFGMILHEDSKYVHLNEDSRASDEEVNQEIFPDVAAAVVFGLHDKNFFSKAFEDDKENRIGFAKYNSYVKDLICGIHQYFEQVARGVNRPDDFNYSPDECIQ